MAFLVYWARFFYATVAIVRLTFCVDIYIYIIQFICILESQSGRVLDGELLYTKILEVNLSAFAYRLFHRDFSPLNGAPLNRAL